MHRGCSANNVGAFREANLRKQCIGVTPFGLDLLFKHTQAPPLLRGGLQHALSLSAHAHFSVMLGPESGSLCTAGNIVSRVRR